MDRWIKGSIAPSMTQHGDNTRIPVKCLSGVAASELFISGAALQGIGVSKKWVCGSVISREFSLSPPASNHEIHSYQARERTELLY